MSGNLRRKNIISQHIDVALVYKDMLGLDEAIGYLDREHVPKAIAERVLLTEDRRRPPRPPTAAGAAMAAVSLAPLHCRRKNRVHDAIVEAALKIEQRFGTARALELLAYEDVPETVAERLAAEGPRQLRVKKIAL